MYYTAIDAHELSVGDTVYVADSLQDLKEQIRKKSYPVKIDAILGEEAPARFSAKGLNWNLAYLIERKNKKKLRAFKSIDELVANAPKGVPGYPDNPPAIPAHRWPPRNSGRSSIPWPGRRESDSHNHRRPYSPRCSAAWAGRHR